MNTTMLATGIRPALNLTHNLNLNLSFAAPGIEIKRKIKIKIKKLATAAAMLAFLSWPVFAAEVSLESAPPVVVKTVPVAGTADVDPGLTELRVTYSKAMQDGSWSWSTWGEENYPKTTGEARYQGDARTCVLPVKLQSGKFYAIWLNSDKFKNFKDVSGRPAVPYLLTFFTSEVSSGAVLPPKVVSMTPPNGATNIDSELTEIKVVFDQPMMDRSWSMTGGGDRFPESAGAIRYDAKRLTWIAPVKLKPGWKYEFGLNSQSHRNFKSEKGISLEPIWVTFATGGGSGAMMEREVADPTFLPKLNDDQRAVLAWTDRQFRSFFDSRTFDGWSDEERATLERKSIDALSGPRSTEYYQAINTLAALRSTKAVPRLREIALDRLEKDNRDRWMAIRALGMIGDKADVPELIQLVYHGNVNTRWWAQISLVRLTGQNFAKDWNAWGKWWNDQNGQPPFKPEIIRWWNGQPEPDKLAESLEESDSKFLNGIKPQATIAKEMEERDQTQTGEQYLQEQLKLAKAGNYWAKFNLWEAFSRGKHEVAKNPTEADKWLSELVKGAYLARFEPVNGFTPKTPKAMLDKFSEYCQLRSGTDSLGGASFFRTTKQDDKLIGSFLTASPDEFKTALQKNPSLKLISMEKATPEMFLAHEAAKQESL